MKCTPADADSLGAGAPGPCARAGRSAVRAGRCSLFPGRGSTGKEAGTREGRGRETGREGPEVTGAEARGRAHVGPPCEAPRGGRDRLETGSDGGGGQVPEDRGAPGGDTALPRARGRPGDSSARAAHTPGRTPAQQSTRRPHHRDPTRAGAQALYREISVGKRSSLRPTLQGPGPPASANPDSPGPRAPCLYPGRNLGASQRSRSLLPRDSPPPGPGPFLCCHISVSSCVSRLATLWRWYGALAGSPPPKRTVSASPPPSLHPGGRGGGGATGHWPTTGRVECRVLLPGRSPKQRGRGPPHSLRLLRATEGWGREPTRKENPDSCVTRRRKALHQPRA